MWGSDPFEKLNIANGPLRLQLERELQSKLLLLQQNYIETDGQPKELRELLARSLSSFTVLFKSVLRLAGKSAPAKKQEAWKAVSAHVPIDVDALWVIYNLRQGEKEALKHSPDDLMSRLMRSVKAAIDYVDTLAVK